MENIQPTTLKIYVDTSVYNRPFDDQRQFRIWFETMAFSRLLILIKTGEVELVTSSVIAYENSRNPFLERQQFVSMCLALSSHHTLLTKAIKTTAKQLTKYGFKPLDAFHLACAEASGVDYFLTCDDEVITHYQRRHLMVCNPVPCVFQLIKGGAL